MTFYETIFFGMPKIFRWSRYIRCCVSVDFQMEQLKIRKS